MCAYCPFLKSCPAEKEAAWHVVAAEAAAGRNDLARMATPRDKATALWSMARALPCLSLLLGASVSFRSRLATLRWRQVERGARCGG